MNNVKYKIHLKCGAEIEAEVKDNYDAGFVMHGLITFGNVVVNLDEFKCAFPIYYE